MRVGNRAIAPFVRRAAFVAVLAAVVVCAFLAHSATDGTDAAGASALATAGFDSDGSATADRLDAPRRPAGDPETGGFYCAPVGTEFTMRVLATSASQLRIRMLDQAIDQAIDSNLDGTMRVRIAARQGDELIAQIAFTAIEAADVTADTGETRNAELEEDLRQAVLVRMRDDGELVAVRFQPGARAFARGWERSLLTSMRFVVPADAAKTWNREEVDATGVAQVRYEELPSAAPTLQLRRTKLAYIAPPPGADPNSSPARLRVTGDGVATLDGQLGWARAVAVAETITAETDRIPTTMTVKYSVKATLVSVGAFPLDASTDVNFDDVWGSIAGLEDLAAMSTSAKEANYAEYLKGIPLSDLLAKIAQVLAAEPVDNAALVESFRNLSWYFQLHPEAFEEAGSFLASASTDVARIVLNAAGAAGTAAAQEFLAAYIADPSQDVALRRLSLESLIQIATPSDRLVDTVLGSIAAGSPDAVRGTALLVIGALASRGGEQHDALVNALLAREAEAGERGELPVWLGALGNAADSRAFGPASAYLDATNPAVRSAAVDAIAKFPTPAATAALVERANNDSDPTVRSSALEALSRRSGDAAMDAVRHALGHEDAETRLALIHGLGQQLASNDAARTILCHVAATDKSPKVRSIAQELLDAAH